jgi:hypothetical protein
VPIPFAHPAAAVPLRRVLGRAGVLSALVIGSFVPDLHYFVPLPIARDSTHSLPGLLWFCLPLGLLVYFLFHRVLEEPLAALLPTSWQERLAFDHAPPALPPVPWWAVCVSLVVGAFTHVVWDAVAHATPSTIARFPFLDIRLFTLSGYPMYVHKVLLNGSSVIGVALLWWWSARWLRRSPPTAIVPTPRVHPALRAVIVAVLLAMMALAAASEADIPSRVTLRTFQRYAVAASVPSLSSLGGGLLLYCVGWHCLRAARRPASS